MALKFQDELQGHTTLEDSLEAIDIVYRANKKHLYIAYTLLLTLLLGALGFIGFMLEIREPHIC